MVDIDVEFPTANGKALLNSDNPYRLADSGDTEESAEDVEGAGSSLISIKTLA